LTITQTHLAPVKITPKTKNLFEFLKRNSIDSLDSLFKQELSIDYILSQFVISKQELIKVMNILKNRFVKKMIS